MSQNENDILEIDVWKLFLACLKKWWIIAIATVGCGVVVLLYSLFFIIPTYASTIKLYVNNSNNNPNSVSITASDMNASAQLVDVYEVILNTKDTLDVVLDRTGLASKYETKDLSRMLQTKAVNGTQVFQVTVTNSSPEEAQLIASTIGIVLPEKIAEVIDKSDARIVENAVIPTEKVAPSNTKNAFIGLLVGFFVSVAVIIVVELLDSTIKSEDDLNDITDLPILSRIPDFFNNKKKSNPQNTPVDINSGSGLCERNNFITSEAYKMLRTKLNLLIPQMILTPNPADSESHENHARIIGVTSSLRSEGKSTTSINLAYTMAESGSKVCLVEADMRLPNIAKRLNLSATPGLSNVLTGQCPVKSALQRYSSSNGTKFFVITAGDIPPTPSELLESQSMDNVLATLSTVFDVIIVDLPPVTAVTDALAVAPKLSGMLLVVRESYCNRYALNDTIKQLRLAETKLFGVVLNCTDDFAGKSKYYSKYYTKYYTKNDPDGESITDLNQQ